MQMFRTVWSLRILSLDGELLLRRGKNAIGSRGAFVAIANARGNL